MPGLSRRLCETYVPPPRQQLPHRGPREAVVDQIHDSLVVLGADHAASGLHHFLDAGHQVGVVVAGAEHLLQAGLELFVPRVHLRQSQCGDEGADQPVTAQVDAFAEAATQHREADARAPGWKRSRNAVRLPSSIPRTWVQAGTSG